MAPALVVDSVGVVLVADIDPDRKALNARVALADDRVSQFGGQLTALDIRQKLTRLPVN